MTRPPLPAFLLRPYRAARGVGERALLARRSVGAVWEEQRRVRLVESYLSDRPAAATARAAGGVGGGGPLTHCRVCNLEDFEEAALRSVIREIYLSAEVASTREPTFPAGSEERKQWEVAMAVWSLGDLGVLRADAEILGVGAGREVTLFWLTNLVRRVFATDLYLAPGSWDLTAPPTMLVEPSPPNPLPWHPERLVAQHMDALDLRFASASFDGVFSSSSIEHFGDHRAVRRSLEEMHRVLRPGGVLSLSTELRLSGPGPGLPGTLLFSADELENLLLTGLGWHLASPLQLTVSERTRASVTEFRDAVDDVRNQRPRWRTYPHIVMRAGEHTWTSVHVALIKD